MHHSDFVHLHNHTQFSLLDGMLRLDQLFKRAAEYKMPAVAMTDHGNMFGAVDFYKKALKAGLKPILGCEVYIAPGSRFERKSTRGISDAAYHLILLIKNDKGYKNLAKLVTAGFLEGFYYRPRIDKEILRQHSEGLIALSACLKGEVSQHILRGNMDAAMTTASEFREIMDEDSYYIEIMDHGMDDQKEVNKGLLELSKKLELPLVATNDAHYLEQKHARAQEILLCLQTGKTLNDAKRMQFSTDQFYFKPPDEMKAIFQEHPEAIQNTIRIAEKCNFDMEINKQFHLPHYQVPSDSTLDSFLDNLAHRGLEKRFKKMKESGEEISPETEEFYKKRLETELKIIKEMNFSGYFLIVWDFIDYAFRHDIPVGPGRGSAAGSLVAYTLRITNIDPLKYNLLFERFLNPERVSMPDIDIDFCMDKREQVIKYVNEKYGRENVCQIITFGSMNAKGVIRDVGRVLDMPYGDVDRIAKLVPNRLNIKLAEAISEEPKLQELSKKDAQVSSLLDFSLALEGLSRHCSTHAAGVVISPKPLVEYLPLYKGGKDEIVTQFTMGCIDDLGLLKMDFLGLRTLTVIDKAVRLIRDNGKGENFDANEISLEDSKTYELLSDARTLGVFQLESGGMRDLVKKIKPNCFEDIIALLALYRPGPLNSGMVDDFIQVKHGKKEQKFEVPELKEILKHTNGVILYQEQVMRIAVILAGFSMGMADLLRRAMGKKKAEEMADMRVKFVEGAKKNKIPEKKATRIFELMEHFAGYGFNKSHSAAYALISYQTAYLKAHYPLEFMASLISSDMDNTDKVIQYINECREMGISILPPDLNKGVKDFTVTGNSICFGLAAIKNVGSNAIESICSFRDKEGEFESLRHFCESVDSRTVNKRVIESLIKCGAFDTINMKRAELMADLPTAMELGQQTQKDRSLGQMGLFGSEEIAASGPSSTNGREVPPWTERERLANEKETLGFYITGHPLESHLKELKQFSDYTSQNVFEAVKDETIHIGGIVGKVKVIVVKQGKQKGRKMANIMLEDMEGQVEVTVFASTYEEAAPYLEGMEPILITGNLDRENDPPKILAQKVVPLTEAKKGWEGNITVRLHTAGLDREALVNLKKILLKHKGGKECLLNFYLPDNRKIAMRTDHRIRITPSEELVSEIEELVGEHSVYFG